MYHHIWNWFINDSLISLSWGTLSSNIISYRSLYYRLILKMGIVLWIIDSIWFKLRSFLPRRKYVRLDLKMSTVTLLRRIVGRQIFNSLANSTPVSFQIQPRRNQWKLLKLPKPGVLGKSYRRIVHFKDEYTIEPLQVTNLAGRDPVSGKYFFGANFVYCRQL